MSNPFIGEIRLFGANFPPAGWAFCEGQIMPISQNEALFQLLGTTFGGDGETTYGIPNLASRVPMHFGQGPGISQNYQYGEQGGVESVTLTTQAIPNHTHAMLASNANGQQPQPQNGYLAQTNPGFPYVAASSPYSLMNPGELLAAGGSQPHENCQPFLVISFIIALAGIFPTT
jgi:microcystin-dependent protein